MAFQALRRVASSPLRLGAARHLAQQQGLWLFPAATRCSGMAAAAEARAPLWAIATRMASSVRDVARDIDGGLLSVLKSELDHESKTYSQPKEVARGPPKPWTLTDKKGHADVILRRTYGAEDIAVTCVYQPDSYEADETDEPRDDDGDDEHSMRDSSSINMTITINKGSDSPTLEISAASYGTGVTIEHVYFWDDKDTKESSYDGPNFLQLDEEVQSQFEKFVKARGVNDNFVGFLFSLLADKEQREYMRWLEKVEAFLKQ